MENLTAKQLEEKIGFGRYSVKGGTYALWIGEFCFFLYDLQCFYTFYN